MIIAYNDGGKVLRLIGDFTLADVPAGMTGFEKLEADFPPGEDQPFWVMDGSGNVTVDTVAKADAAKNLDPPEFNRLLRLSGLDDAWDALAAYLKSTNRTLYADLQGERDKTVFRLSYTLTKVAEFRPVLTEIGYDISELTDANITTQWDAVLAERV
jgi:hypothetical protein